MKYKFEVEIEVPVEKGILVDTTLQCALEGEFPQATNIEVRER